MIDLQRFTAGNDERNVVFERFIVHMHKGEKFIVVSDSLGHLATFKGKGDKGNHFEFKSRLFTGVKESIMGMSRHQQNILYVQKKKIGFLRVVDG